MSGENDTGAWLDMAKYLAANDLRNFWSRYHHYLIENGVVSARRAMLVVAISRTVQLLTKEGGVT